MAVTRTKAKKRRKKKSQRSRGPAIFLIMVFVATGIVLLAQVGNSTMTNTPVDVNQTTIAVPVGDSSAPSNSSSTIPNNPGQPVIIHSDTLGDLEVDQVIEDWTGVDPPVLPAEISQVGDVELEGDFIANDLPDGFYAGYLVNALDEDEQGFVFDIRDSISDSIPATGARRFYPAYLDQILFVSLSTSGEANTAITVATYFELALNNTGSLPIPNTDLTATVTGTYMLLTIVDGTVIFVEGFDAV